MVHPRRTLVALIAAAVMLGVAGWYDGVMAAVQRDRTPSFELTQTAVAVPFLGFLMVVAGVLLLALLARWADSRLFDGVYALGGAFFVVLAILAWSGVVSITSSMTEDGPLNAVDTLAAALLLIGLADFGLAFRRRPAWAATAIRPSWQPEPCLLCGDDTSVGSPLYSDRLIAHHGDVTRYLCALCAQRARGGSRDVHQMSDEARKRLQDATFAFGSFMPGGH